MAKARQCDRCGKLYTDSKCHSSANVTTADGQELMIHIHNVYALAGVLDLCDDCSISLQHWFNEKDEFIEKEEEE